MTRLITLLLALSLLSLGPVAAPAQAEEPLPPFNYSDPWGANDWGCQPTTERPSPVVLVHGTFGDQRSLLDRISYTLVQQGYCVFSLNYGDRATGPIEDSAAELASYVDAVLAATGAVRVSLVGHSQGGMMPRHYIKFLGGDAYVDDLIGIAPSNHGTTRSENLGPFGEYCRACEQQATDSQFLTELNAGDESPGAVSYTQVTTRYDQVVVPHTSGYLELDAGVTNVTLQDACPLNVADHVTIVNDGAAIEWTLDALGHAGPADPAFQPSCTP